MHLCTIFKKNHIIVLLLAAVNFTNILDFMVLMPLGATIEKDFAMTSLQWGAVVASYSFTAFFSGLLSIFFIDKVNRRKLLLWVYAGFVIGTFICGQSTSYTSLIVSRMFTGAFGGILAAVALTIITEIVAPNKRGWAVGIFTTGFSVAAALGVPIGNLIGTLYHWQFTFTLIGIVAFMLLIAIYFIMPSLKPTLYITKNKNNFIDTLQGVRAIFMDRNQCWALFLLMIMVIGQFTVIPFMSPYMVRNVGFQEIELSYIYFFGGLFTIFTNPFIGRLSDRFGLYKVFMIFCILSCIPLFLVTTMQASPIWYALIATTLFFVFISGRFTPGTALIIGTATPEHRGMFMSIRSSVQKFSSALASFIGGLIVVKNQGGQFENFEVVGIIAIISSILAIFIARKIIVKN